MFGHWLFSNSNSSPTFITNETLKANLWGKQYVLIPNVKSEDILKRKKEYMYKTNYVMGYGINHS